jgi:biopolymer transport protein ExbB
MLGLLEAGGWVMYLILVCSIVALAIIGERLWYLREKNIAPPHLVKQMIAYIEKNGLQTNQIRQLSMHSPLGIMLVAGLKKQTTTLSVMKTNIEDAGRVAILRLEKYLNLLGTIAAVAPLLGLLGTVMGMIEVFGVLQTEGTNNTNEMANGISEALLTTAFGLLVAIPSLMFHRFFQRRVDELALRLEEEAVQFIDMISLSSANKSS